jgi:hypothetical protein
VLSTKSTRSQPLQSADLRGWVCSGPYRSSYFTRLFSTLTSLASYSRTMDPPQNQFRVPNIKFRVLIIGRANAGKTSILKRVCNTTESPKVYRVDRSGQRSEVRSRSWWHPHQSHPLVRFNSTLQLRLDRHILVGDD